MTRGVMRPLGADNQQLFPASPYESGDEQVITDIAEILDILSRLQDIAKNICDAVFKQQLQSKLQDANAKAQDAMARAKEAGDKMAEAQNNLNSVNSEINGLASSLADLGIQQQKIASELGAIQGMITNAGNGIKSLEATTSSLTSQLKTLQSPASRAKYPAGGAGLTQWRNDQLALANQIKQTQIQTLDAKKARDVLSLQANDKASQSNSLNSQAKSISSQIEPKYAVAKGYESVRNLNAQLYNSAYADAQSAASDASDAVAEYQDCVTSTGVPLTEGSAGAKALASALRKFAQNKNFSASADLFRAGFESGVRNFGDAGLAMAGPWVSASISIIGDSAQKTYDESTSEDLWENIVVFGENAAIAGGNAFVGLNYWVAGVDSLELSDAILSNPNNPNALRDATNEWGRNGLPNFILGVGKSGITFGSPFLPPGTGQMAEPVLRGVAVGASGLVGTATRLELAPLTTPLTPGEYIKSGTGGRNIFKSVPPGFASKPSLVTVTVGAMGITLDEMGKSAINGAIRNDPAGTQNLYNRLDDLVRVYSVQESLKTDRDIDVRPGYIDFSGVTQE